MNTFAKDVKSQPEWFVIVRNKKQVIFDELLRENPTGSHLCSQLSFLLVTMTNKHRNCSGQSSKKYRDFCYPSLKHFILAHFVDVSGFVSELDL